MKRHLKIVKDPTPIPPARPMEKRITFFGQPAKVACDGRCSKAWGINSRPSVQLSDDEDKDDYYYVPDGELADAPADPGTEEGGYGKPLVVRDADDMNKWCVRECERCVMSEPGAADKPLVLRDFSQRWYNKPQKTTGTSKEEPSTLRDSLAQFYNSLRPDQLDTLSKALTEGQKALLTLFLKYKTLPSLPQFLTETQIAEAHALFKEQGGVDAKGKIQKQVIEPNMAAINQKLGQENDPSCLAYAVVYVFSPVSEWADKLGKKQ